MLRYREFQTVRGTGCLREQGILRGVMPPSVSIFFSSFLLTAALKRRVRFGNERRKPKNRGHGAVWWLCVTLSLCATKVTHWSSGVRERSRILVQVYGHAAAKPYGNAGRSP
ncbi:hypothetical protein DTV46_02835 [Salmonella enterica subsp. salamae]|nr:hypothetical protein [Salmonella enterica subsp. salamae]